MPGSHKTLEQIKADLDVFGKYRKSYAVCIAGGEPLLHPQLAAVVRLVADRGYKPMLNTNAVTLTEERLRELKAAGLAKLTLHIDSRQQRPGWTGKNEPELNELRLSLARMAAKVGGLCCTFNATIYADTLKHVPELMRWAQDNIDVVHSMCFIVFRAAGPKGLFDYYAKGVKVELPAQAYRSPQGVRADISVGELVEEIRKAYPDFEPCAYLNATGAPDMFKWLLTIRTGTKDAIYGYLGPKFVELIQTTYHLLKGKYLGPVAAATHRRAKRLFLAAIFDKATARALKNYLRACLKAPLKLFQRVHMQTITIIQPVDVLDDGSQAMCDGCPDMTVWEGQLVPSCRLDELKFYGCLLTTTPAARQGGE